MMNGLLVLALLLMIVGLIWGLIMPRHLASTARIKRQVRRKHVALLFGPAMLACLILIGITAPPEHKSTGRQTLTLTPSSSDNQVQTDIVTTKTITVTRHVPFKTVTQEDSALAKGKTKVGQEGKDGVETLTYTVTYTNGQESSRNLDSDVVTKQPVDKIVIKGTYVASTPIADPTPAPIPQPSCYPLTNRGNCYEPGEFCRNSDHGASGIAGDGKAITCLDNDGWRWEP